MNDHLTVIFVALFLDVSSRISISRRYENVADRKDSCNVVPFFYPHSVVIQHFLVGTVYQTVYFLEFQSISYIMLNKNNYPIQ